MTSVFELEYTAGGRAPALSFVVSLLRFSDEQDGSSPPNLSLSLPLFLKARQEEVVSCTVCP